MYIRRAFTVFVAVQSPAEPRAGGVADWTLDWRWFEESPPQAISPPAIGPVLRQTVIREE
jgi:hypothetical protein